MAYPYGIAVDSSGSLYIASDNRIRKVSNGVITTVAGNGTQGFSGDNGPATSAQLNEPTDVTVDSVGRLYIADSGNARVRMTIPSGPSCSAVLNQTSFAPGFAGGDLSVSIQTSSSCAWAVQTLPSWITYSGNVVGTGSATITLMVAANTGVARSTTISIAGVSLAVTQAGAPGSLAVSAVTNAASNLAGPVALGEIVTLYGSGLGPTQLVKATLGSDGLYGGQLAGTSVFFNGIAAPMIYSSATQVAAIVPYEITGATAQVTVTYQGQTTTRFSVPIVSSAPGIFSLDSTGQGQAAAINQDGITINGAANPARIGDVISLYATGEGQTTPGGVDGKPASAPLPQPNLPVSVTIGGQRAQFLPYVGGAPGEVAGLLQINVQIPSRIQTGNAVPVVV